MITCPKKNKHCKPQWINRRGEHFICGGITSRPVKYKFDVVSLCFKGRHSKFAMQMTSDEAIDIVEVLIKIIKNIF